MNPRDYKDAIKNITTRPSFKESDGKWKEFVEANEKAEKDHLKKLIKFELEESQKPVIKNPVLREALEPKVSEPKIFKDNINEASPEQFRDLAYKLEKNRQMEGKKPTDLKEFENRFKNKSVKKKITYPEIKIPTVNLNLVDRKPPEPDIPIEHRIQILADERLVREQRAWDQANGRGGITEMYRPK